MTLDMDNDSTVAAIKWTHKLIDTENISNIVVLIAQAWCSSNGQ